MNYSQVLVTGSAGFIGFHVTKRLLEDGVTVVGVDNLNNYYDPNLKKMRSALLERHKNYIFHQLDISEGNEVLDTLGIYKFDKICHLAAQAGVRYSLDNPSLYIKANIDGFITLLEFARKQQIRDVIYASSSSVYGNNTMPKSGFSEEDSVNQPISIYGMTKRANELSAYTYHHLYQMHITGLRFFTAYGPWGRPDMAYYSFTKAIDEGKPITLFNHGKMRRDFTYIDDIVDGVVSALEKAYPLEVFNLGNSQTVELDEFIQSLEKHLGKKAVLNYAPLQPGDVLETFANISHAKDKLGFSPKTKIDEGLGKFIQWYRSYYEEQQ